METIKNITTEMREFADLDACTIGRDVLRRRIQHFARRIDEASTNCNQHKMREALVAIKELDFYKEEDCHAFYRIIDDALSAPPRNCDVGTAEEQIERFDAECLAIRKRNTVEPCAGCPCSSGGEGTDDCQLCWAQMPYEEGGAE